MDKVGSYNLTKPFFQQRQNQPIKVDVITSNLEIITADDSTPTTAVTILFSISIVTALTVQVVI